MSLPPSPSSAMMESRQSRGRHRHFPHQTEALNEVFERTDHPSLQERVELGKRLDMETKVVNSWFQNKRATLRKRAARAGQAPDAFTLTAESSQAGDVPPRSQHPSLPPIAALLRASPAPSQHTAQSDPEEDRMAVQLPPIRENTIFRPAFLSPTLAAVCLPQPLPDTRPRLASQPSLPSSQPPPLLLSSTDYRRAPSSLPTSRAVSPYVNRSPIQGLGLSLHGSEHDAQWPASSRAPSDTFESRSRSSQRHSYPSRLALATRHSSVGPSRSIRLSDAGSALTREASPAESQEEDELSDDRPDVSAAAGGSYKARHRPTPAQLDELRATFAQYTHPSRQERERLAHVTGLRMQSISNWFQHQRSMAKRRREDGISEPAAVSLEARPPASGRKRSPAPSAAPTSARPKRLRPEPHQLEALKALYAQSTNPSVEQRAALALEYDMPESKVTNWFRNARQTVKRKAGASKLADVASDMDVDEEAQRMHGSNQGGNASAFARCANLTHPEPSDMYDMHMDVHDSASHTGSDEEEAMTPSPTSPSTDLYAGPQARGRKRETADVDDAALLLGLRNHST